MASQVGNHGVGAIVSALIRFIHPSEHIRNKFPNPVQGQRLDGCVTLRQEVKRITKKDQLSIVVRHDDFTTDNGEFIELYAVKRYWRIQQPGDSDLYFDEPSGPEALEENAVNFPLPEAVNVALQGSEDLLHSVEVLRDVMEVDDDNEPAPENIPQPTDSTASIFSENWGHNGICFRKAQSMPNSRAQINFRVDHTEKDYFVQLFEGLFPKDHLHLMIEEMNKKMEGEPISYGELLRWIGLWVLMSTVDGADRRSFWSAKEIDMFEGAPFRLTYYMSRNRFEAILNNLIYTGRAPPEFPDRFWEVRDMIAAWNKNMAQNFVPSWINCIDESMSKWVNEYTCPGFMFVPRKPWPFGNEYHDAGCADSDIIWAVDLREGKDRPRELGNKEHDNLGKTVGILMRLTEPVWGGGRVFVLDSGFCVLQGIVELKKKGVFAAALIKKRRYWPKHVPGDRIIDHFANKEVGTTDALQGMLDGIPFHIHAMKEPDYVMMLMSTYGSLAGMGDEKKRHFTVGGQRCMRSFRYPEVVYNHYRYRDVIDNHNSSWMHPISMEETWMTTDAEMAVLPLDRLGSLLLLS